MFNLFQARIFVNGKDHVLHRCPCWLVSFFFLFLTEFLVGE